MVKDLSGIHLHSFLKASQYANASTLTYRTIFRGRSLPLFARRRQDVRPPHLKDIILPTILPLSHNQGWLRSAALIISSHVLRIHSTLVPRRDPSHAVL